MTETERKTCKKCQAEIPADRTETLCPACLMAVALGPLDTLDVTMSLGLGDALSRNQHRDFPCEFGGYRLVGFLGRGGMGTVYEAEELATGRRVALKMLAQQMDSPEMRKRFMREGRLAAEVNHPNSLYVFGSDEIDGVPVITMEVASSGTLKDKLKANGPLPVSEAVDAILDVIDGLEAAHQRGVLHRDIKPSNCFVNPDGSVKVGDFGLSVSTLAKTDTLVTAHGKIMGTPAYSSPEQLRGDTLDVRADIYSVGATLYTLLTDMPPFEGDNAVQVVANAVNQKARPMSGHRGDVPAGLERVVSRCMAKEAELRYGDYLSLRNALLPFSSQVAEPANMLVRVAAGWMDYLIGFMVPYVVIMLTVGANKLIVTPLVDRTVYSFRYYIALFAFGFLYFAIAEGYFGYGLGKYLKGLEVVDTRGKRAGFWRALVRIVLPITCVEGVRMPITFMMIRVPDWSGLQTAMFVLLAIGCGWIPVIFALIAKADKGYATIWDLLSGTRVQIRRRTVKRPGVVMVKEADAALETAKVIGPYRVMKEIVAGEWLLAVDPVLKRKVWLLREDAPLGQERKALARLGRLRWLQDVENNGTIWNAFEAADGVAFAELVSKGKELAWSTVRHWLYDVANELWQASGDGTLPEMLCLGQVWISSQGNVVLLDRVWPECEMVGEAINVRELSGQQAFLSLIASCVEPTSQPLHARGVLENIKDGKFEKLSFLTGILQGLLDKPADVSKGIRAGSIFMLPGYILAAVFIGYYHDKMDQMWNNILNGPVMMAMLILAIMAMGQLLMLPFRSSASQVIFRLAVINAKGRKASPGQLLLRWAIVWVPLFAPITALMFLPLDNPWVIPGIFIIFVVWIAAGIYAAVHPHRGLHDRLAGTWVVRR